MRTYEGEERRDGCCCRELNLDGRPDCTKLGEAWFYALDSSAHTRKHTSANTTVNLSRTHSLRLIHWVRRLDVPLSKLPSALWGDVWRDVSVRHSTGFIVHTVTVGRHLGTVDDAFIEAFIRSRFQAAVQASSRVEV